MNIEFSIWEVITALRETGRLPKGFEEDDRCVNFKWSELTSHRRNAKTLHKQQEVDTWDKMEITGRFENEDGWE